MSARSGEGDDGATAAAAHNLWDAMVALIVVGALVVLVVYLVRHYGSDTEKIAAVLGIAAPVLAAAFGVSIGYYSGNKTGQTTGKEKGKKEMASKLYQAAEALETQPRERGEGADSIARAAERLRGIADGAS
jgi:hypothetical protein